MTDVRSARWPITGYLANSHPPVITTVLASTEEVLKAAQQIMEQLEQEQRREEREVKEN